MATTTSRRQREPVEDQDLERRILQFLSETQRTPLRGIKVHVDHGRVTLTGILPSFYEKQLCLRCFQQVDGVTHVVDRIDVRYSD